MLKEWKKKLDDDNIIKSIFMEFSKAFDAVNHNLLTAKLEGYGLSDAALIDMRNYLKQSETTSECQ